MEVFKPGKQKPPRRGARPEPQLKVKQIKASPVDDADLPTKIEVEQSGTVKALVPSSVWRCGAFKWDPVAFATESDELNQKFIEPSVQDRSLARFLKKPSIPMIYGVGGNPDDLKAKLFAAYLLAAHCKRYKSDANPWWIQLTGGFDNPWINGDKSRPSMIVLAGLTPQSTNQKLEKARDIIEAFPDVPRIVVCAGTDPFAFLASRLHVPINGLAYFCEAIVRQKIEVI
jgi:hypothetical protein